MKLLKRELRESRVALAAWCAGLAAAVVMYVPFYPSIGGSGMMSAYLEAFPPEVARLFGFDRMATGAGYVQASYFGLTAFLLLAIAAIGWGSRAVAGAEAAGTLELTLAHGVTRWQVVTQAALALLVRLAVVSAAGSLVVWALDGSAGLELDPAGLWAATAALFLLGAVAGAAALFGGAVSGRPAVATGVGAAVAVLAYVCDAVADLAGARWLGRLSPYEWAFGRDPITTGFDLSGLALLALATLVLVVVGGLVFDRRDLRSP